MITQPEPAAPLGSIVRIRIGSVIKTEEDLGHYVLHAIYSMQSEGREFKKLER